MTNLELLQQADSILSTSLISPEDIQKVKRIISDEITLQIYEASQTEDSYALVQWPESQEYMEEKWFEEEAIFCGGSEEKTGSSAYFIPLKRVLGIY